MSNNRDLLETSDERNCNRLHQQQRYSIRRETRTKILSKHTSGTNKFIRSPARSWKNRELVSIEDEDEDFFDWPDDYVLSYRSSYFQEPLELLVHQAIIEWDASYLDILLKYWKIDQNPNQKNGSRYRCSWKKIPRSLHTMLTYAIICGDFDCIQTIVDPIDCGQIYSGIVDHVCSNGTTALWYACNYGDLNLVQQLVEHLPANVNQCGVLIVAAQNSRQDIVEYLLSQGADPNQDTKNYDERALHAAARRNHLGIVNILLKHGADPHITDRYGNRTALDYAIHKRHIDIAKALIHHHAGRFFMNQNGLTPLMLAVSCNDTTVVDIFSHILPRRPFLDELALLACNYTISGSADKRDHAYVYFERALSMDTPSSSSYKSTPCEVYEFRSECQTLDELALIPDDDNAMRMHALLVSERLLRERNEVQHFLSLLMKQSNIYEGNELYHRCLQLRMHAYRILLQTDDQNHPDLALHGNYLFELVSILFKLLLEEGVAAIESLVIVWKWILHRAQEYLVSILLKLIFMTTYLVESNRLNATEYRLFFSLVQRTLRRQFETDGHFIFSDHIARIRSNTTDVTYSSISIPILSIIRLLIDCGANVDEVSGYQKITPLHIIGEAYDVDENLRRSIIKLLLDANAHTDFTDLNGRLPEDCTHQSEGKELLRANRKLSLKCRCAQLINSEQVNYENLLSSHLIAFIHMHRRRRHYHYWGSSSSSW